MNCAAAMPNTAFNGTATAATIRVSLIAEDASGFREGFDGLDSAFRQGLGEDGDEGANKRNARNSTTTAISATRKPGHSVVTGRWACGPVGFGQWLRGVRHSQSSGG